MTARTQTVVHWVAAALLALAIAAVFLGAYLVGEANAAAQSSQIEGVR